MGMWKRTDGATDDLCRITTKLDSETGDVEFNIRFFVDSLSAKTQSAQSFDGKLKDMFTYIYELPDLYDDKIKPHLQGKKILSFIGSEEKTIVPYSLSLSKYSIQIKIKESDTPIVVDVPKDIDLYTKEKESSWRECFYEIRPNDNEIDSIIFIKKVLSYIITSDVEYGVPPKPVKGVKPKRVSYSFDEGAWR